MQLGFFLYGDVKLARAAARLGRRAETEEGT